MIDCLRDTQFADKPTITVSQFADYSQHAEMFDGKVGLDYGSECDFLNIRVDQSAN